MVRVVVSGKVQQLDVEPGVWGRRVSRTLKEELMWDRSRVTSVDWVTYPILTFPEIPEVEVELIDRPKEGGVATAVSFHPRWSELRTRDTPGW